MTKVCHIQALLDWHVELLVSNPLTCLSIEYEPHTQQWVAEIWQGSAALDIRAVGQGSSSDDACFEALRSMLRSDANV